MNNNELLQKILDIKKKYNRSAFGLLGGNEEYMYLDTVRESMQEYAEVYHAAKLAEVAQGECFTPNEAHNIYCDYANIPEYTREWLADKLNAKSSAFAAAKVDGMFTEEQVREAMYNAYVNGPGRNDWAEYEEEIINQLKASK